LERLTQVTLLAPCFGARVPVKTSIVENDVDRATRISIEARPSSSVCRHYRRSTDFSHTRPGVAYYPEIYAKVSVAHEALSGKRNRN
jgi:hypothetical protein